MTPPPLFGRRIHEGAGRAGTEGRVARAVKVRKRGRRRGRGVQPPRLQFPFIPGRLRCRGLVRGAPCIRHALIGRRSFAHTLTRARTSNGGGCSCRRSPALAPCSSGAGKQSDTTASLPHRKRRAPEAFAPSSPGHELDVGPTSSCRREGRRGNRREEN